MEFSNQSNVVIEGPVLLRGNLSGGGANFNLPIATQVNLTGTATATRAQQPYSTVQLIGSPSLSSITGNQAYAIWLANGTTGRWYPIQSVNTSANTLMVIGEANITAPVNYKIGLNLTQCASMNGPVVANSVNFSSEPMWSVNSFTWSNAYNNWTNTNSIRQSQGQLPMFFSDWVANPANMVASGFLLPYQTSVYGLQLQPTVSLQPTMGMTYLASPPLFTPYESSGADSSASGYRWSIVTWREDI
jgi:hypothetical protein